MGYRPVFTASGSSPAGSPSSSASSFYARRRIGVKRWRAVHRATIAVWALGVIHALGSGTDAGQVWLQAILLITGIPIVYLFLLRVLPSEQRPASRRRADPFAC